MCVRRSGTRSLRIRWQSRRDARIGAGPKIALWSSCWGSSLSRLPANTHLLQRARHLPGPVAVRSRAGRTRVRNAADRDVGAGEGMRCTLRGELADADDVTGCETAHEHGQRTVARREQRRTLVRRQLVGCEVASARLHERERAVVGYG